MQGFYLSTLRGPWVQFELLYPSNLVGRQVPNIEIGRTLPDGLLGWDAADESLRMFPVVMLLAIVPGGRAGLVSLQPSRDQVWSCVWSRAPQLGSWHPQELSPLCTVG